MIDIYFDATDNTYLIGHNDLLSDGWLQNMPLNIYDVNFTDDTEELYMYAPPLVRSFNTIDDYHQYVQDCPEDFL